MEPPAATARMTEWQMGGMGAPVQSPGGARDDIAKALGIKPEEMHAARHAARRRLRPQIQCDFAIEAALLSKEMGGTPVKVVWTREDDVQHGFYHTVTAERFEAGLDASNKVVAWRHRSAAPSISVHLRARSEASLRHRARHGLGRHAVRRAQHSHGERRGAEPRSHRLVQVGQQRGARLVDAIVRRRNRAPAGQGPQGLPAGADRTGPHRRPAQAGHHASGGTTASPFETYPIDTGRLRRVAELAAKEAGWGKQLPKGQGLGIAAHRSFVSYIATVVHVEVGDKGKITIPRVDTAIDCGFCVHPERVRSQIEGAAVMGLTLAKYGEITAQERRRRAGRTSTTTRSCASTSRPRRRACTSSIIPSTCRRAGSASRACRPSRRRSATPSSPPPASACASCRSAISWPERQPRGRVASPGWQPWHRSQGTLGPMLCDRRPGRWRPPPAAAGAGQAWREARQFRR